MKVLFIGGTANGTFKEVTKDETTVRVSVKRRKVDQTYTRRFITVLDPDNLVLPRFYYYAPSEWSDAMAMRVLFHEQPTYLDTVEAGA